MCRIIPGPAATALFVSISLPPLRQTQSASIIRDADQVQLAAGLRGFPQLNISGTSHASILTGR
ncbi:MAG TPA: hypothetical protein DEV93_14765 [Chloroflexi bacterium]|nr:hypothetical protein [Chloroflexota bacterium]